MSLRPLVPVLLLLPLLSGAMPARPTELRRETKFDFPVDALLQARGGVQYYFAVLHREQSPLQKDPFRRLVPLLPPSPDGWAGLHAMASRFVYSVEKDASFFTPERAMDLAYMNALMPDSRIRRLDDDTFRSELLPASNFEIRFYSERELAVTPRPAPVAAVLAFAPELGMPVAVALQANDSFARVMGMRTAAVSVTWTAYYRVTEGHTRVVTYALTLLHNAPPFFLGGDERLHKALLEETFKLIEGMRRFRG